MWHGTVGSAVVSDARGPEFEYSHGQRLLNNYSLLTVGRKDENKLKEAGKCPLKTFQRERSPWPTYASNFFSQVKL